MKKVFSTIAICAISVSLFAQSLQFQIHNVAFQQGDTVRAKFFCYGYENIGGFQFAMQAETSTLQALYTESVQPVEAGHFSFWGMPGFNLQSGEIRCVFTDTYGSDVEDGTNIFTFVFLALQSGKLSETLTLWADHWLLKPTAGTAQPNEGIPFDITYISETTGTQQDSAISAAYPNPFTDSVYVTLFDGATEAILYDSKGNVVWSMDISKGATEFKITDAMPAGTYYLRAVTSKGVSIATLIKQ